MKINKNTITILHNVKDTILKSASGLNCRLQAVDLKSYVCGAEKENIILNQCILPDMLKNKFIEVINQEIEKCEESFKNL